MSEYRDESGALIFSSKKDSPIYRIKKDINEIKEIVKGLKKDMKEIEELLKNGKI